MMHAKQAALPRKKDGLLRRILINIRQYPVLYLMTIPVIAYFIIFKYIPMYGVVIAFKKFSPAKGILGSPWLGLDHFQAFFSDLYCFRVIRNTLLINLYGLIFGFPFPIIFALLLNEVRSNAFRRVTQTITYMPHFVSVVIICGLTKYFLKSDGLITGLLVNMFNLPKTNMLAVSAYFRTIYTAMNIWQGFGWGSIIYFAALTNVDPALIEAAAIDGANRYQRIVHVSLPAILPTIVTTLILRLGNIMSAGYEKIILLYSPGVYETADIISSYVYRRGLQNFDYSYAAAIDLFNSAVNIVFILLANSVSKSINKTSIW